MNSFLSNKGPMRDYYKEAQRKTKSMQCPLCGGKGMLTSNMYEVALRIPKVQQNGAICLCYQCKENVTRGALPGDKMWMCSNCEIVLCPTCQRTQ
ncbi:hypothetical protein, conserved [Angomonas deanei]|uniref:Uncharacterized protein n=1 Tax=Angomonas deanei TaxID=59799 RepID=A0A7G2C8W4_9TRYP|nr:hypothetical protein, conserved [Angomonas deanei]